MCRRCTKCFTRKTGLTRHMKRKTQCKPYVLNNKKEEINPTSAVDEDEDIAEHQCKYCNQTFTVERSLQRHMKNPRISCFVLNQVESLKCDMNSLLETRDRSLTINNVHKIVNVKNVKKKRNINGNTKRIVAHSQGWKCNICEDILPAQFETDHITPLFKEGNNELSNLQALCNNFHGEKTIMESC